MLGTWWFASAIFSAFVLVPFISYGWGYRGWGPPYPRYVQRRRAARGAASGAAFDHESWGWRGDVLWIVLLGGTLWALATFWWR